MQNNLSQFLANVNWLDIVFCVMYLGLVYKGIRSGAGSQFLSIIVVILLNFCSLEFYSKMASKIFGFLSPDWARALSFFVITAAFFGLLFLVKSGFQKGAQEASSPTDKFGGFMLATIKAGLIFGVVSVQLLLIPADFLRDSVTKGSKTAMFFVRTNAGIYSWITEQVNFLDKRSSGEVVDKLVNSSKKRGLGRFFS
jgi:hypothetical protein